MTNDTKQKLKPLLNLWPAALTGALIACAAPAMKPVLASVPELQEYEASEDSSADKPSLKDSASISKLTKNEKKSTKKGSTSSDAFTDQDSYQDGTYTGSAQGFGGLITVEVVVKDGKISTINVLSADGETAAYFSRAQAVISSIISSGSPNVDTVSGATYSSTGIINAVKRALSSAGGSSADLAVAELTPSAAADSTPVLLSPVSVDASSITATPANTLKDGTYTGSAYGFGGNIVMQVTVSGGKMTGISVLSADGETGSYFNRAQTMISSMLMTQSADVDTVSGATYSSTGIRNAVKNAIAQAVDNTASQASSSSSSGSGSSSSSGSGSTSSQSGVQEFPGQNTTASAVKTNPDVQEKTVGEISAKPEKTLTDGTYTGTGEGFGGDVKMEITVKDGKIVKVQVISADDETPRYFNNAKALLSDILENQSADVDTVSGATYSSEGILEAVKNAMKEAESKETDSKDTGKEDSGEQKETDTEESGQKDTDKTDQEQADEQEKEDSEQTDQEEESTEQETEPVYYDGIFTASALCTDDENSSDDATFWYTVNMSITIENGKITNINGQRVEDYSEDPDSNDTYFNYAWSGRTRKGIFYQGIPDQILERQSADTLDTVSSATYTSKAMIQAAQNALAAAKR